MFKFAVIMPTSGLYAGWGMPTVTTIEIWADNVNEAGGLVVGGEAYTVEILTYDNQLDPGVTLSATRKAIYEDGVKYMITCCLAEVRAVNELTTSEKVIDLTCAAFATSEGIAGPDAPYTFQTYADLWEGASVALDAVQELHPEYTRVGGVVNDIEAGHVARDQCLDVISDMGLTAVDFPLAPADTTDFYSVLTALLAQDIDILINVAFGDEQGGLIIKQARELGYEKQIVFINGLNLDAVMGVCGEEAIEGLISTPDVIEYPTDLGKAFQAEFIERFGGFIIFGGNLLSGQLLLEAAIKKADSFDTDLVKEALGEVEVEGPLGMISFGTNKFSPDLPRYLKMPIPATIVRNGERVDIYYGYSGLWD